MSGLSDKDREALEIVSRPFLRETGSVVIVFLLGMCAGLAVALPFALVIVGVGP